MAEFGRASRNGFGTSEKFVVPGSKRQPWLHHPQV
jgi:hypothetical protein